MGSPTLENFEYIWVSMFLVVSRTIGGQTMGRAVFFYDKLVWISVAGT